MKIGKILEVKNKDEWREWLETNPKKEKEVWLIIYKRRSEKISITYEEAVEEALCFGWIDGIMKSIDVEKFAQRFSPRKPDSVWSLINKKRALKMIKEGKMTEAGLKLIQSARETGKWQAAYSSKTKPTLPLDLKKALKENKVAYKNFNNFSNSQELSYIYWVLSAKRKETRKKRIEVVVARSLKNIKPA